MQTHISGNCRIVLRRRDLAEIGLLIVSSFLVGCSTQEIKLERLNAVLDPTDPNQVIAAKGVSQGESGVILSLREEVIRNIAVDGQRIYWTVTSVTDVYRDLLQSCRFDDCLNTFTTYDVSDNLAKFAVDADYIVWAQNVRPSRAIPQIRTWELRGTSSKDGSQQPLLLDSAANAQPASNAFVLADLLYWWRPGENASSLLRCDPARCEETREILLGSEVPTPVSQITEMVLTGTHAYWLEKSSGQAGARAIQRVSLDGERLAKTVLESPTFISGLSVRDGRLIWAVNNFASPIQSCDVNNCAGTVSTLVANQQYPNWTATTKNHLLWTSDGELRACELSNCQATIETVAHGTGSVTVTDSEVYYTTVHSDGSSCLINRRMLP